MAGYPKAYNIEMDPHEDLDVGGLFSWVSGPALKVVDEHSETLKKYPNPPGAEYHPVQERWWWVSRSAVMLTVLPYRWRLRGWAMAKGRITKRRVDALRCRGGRIAFSCGTMRSRASALVRFQAGPRSTSHNFERVAGRAASP